MNNNELGAVELALARAGYLTEGEREISDLMQIGEAQAGPSDSDLEWMLSQLVAQAGRVIAGDSGPRSESRALAQFVVAEIAAWREARPLPSERPEKERQR